MKAVNMILIAIGCLSPSLSFATECMAGFAERATFGELTAMELDFGARLVPHNSKCSESFKVVFSNIVDASCQVCGQVPAVGDQVIGKRRVTSKGDVTIPRQYMDSPIYAYHISLEEITPGNPLVMRCYGETVRGHSYNISNNREASQVLIALNAAMIKCAKPKVRRSCF